MINRVADPAPSSASRGASLPGLGRVAILPGGGPFSGRLFRPGCSGAGPSSPRSPRRSPSTREAAATTISEQGTSYFRVLGTTLLGLDTGLKGLRGRRWAGLIAAGEADLRTRLAHKVEHAVDLGSGAPVATTLVSGSWDGALFAWDIR